MIYFGFDEVVYGWQRYFDLCNGFELRNAATPDDEPSLSTLNRWRVDSPKGFGWIVHTTTEVNDLLVDAFERGITTIGPEFDEALAATEERAHALSAKAIILETPPELPPSDTSRALVVNLGKRLAEVTKRALIWEASGLWTFEDGSKVAKDAGMAYVVDPFMLAADGETLPKSPVAAFRVTERAAARRQFDGWELEQLVDMCESHERSFVLLAGRYKIPHAKELSLLLREGT